MRWIGPAALLMILAGVAGAAEPARPNVLMIAVDDLNHWVGYLGRNKQTITPNIDRLAARGVRFSRSYCSAPACNPSRAAVLSGMRPSTTGVYKNSSEWRNVIPHELTLISAFRRAGYFTGGSGKIYHGGFDRQSEWDDYLIERIKDPKPRGSKGTDDYGVGGIRFAPLDCDDEEMNDYSVVDYGIEQLRRRHDRPFLLTIGLRKPHMPWNVPRKYFEMHPLESIELPPTIENDLADVPPAGRKMAKAERDHAQMLASGRWKEAVQAYLATITFCDAMTGRLIEALDNSAYRDNTIIVLWSDHGWHLGEKEHWRKFALWEEATRAPMIWVAPGLTRPDALCERTVDFTSIYPTLCDLCGVARPDHVEGKSIRRLLENPSAEWNQPAVTTFEYNNHAVRSEGWRYIRYANGDEELYDEAADPYEWTNLANEPSHAARKAELAKFLPTKNAPDVSDRAGGSIDAE